MKPAGKPLIWAAIALLLIAIGTMVWFGLRIDDASQPPAAPPTQPAPVPPADLAAVLQFEAPESCELAEPLLSVFDALLQAGTDVQPDGTAKPVFVPELDRDVVPVLKRTRQASGNELVETTLPLAGVWHGLAVAGLQTGAVESSGAATHRILFAAPAEQVRTTLNEQGFSLLPVGETRAISDEDGGSLSMGVEALGTGAALSCG